LRSIERLADRSGTFLELGCGTGIFSIHASSLFRRVVGIDKDRDVLELARRNAASQGISNIEWIEADALTLDVRLKADVILCEMISTGLVQEPVVPVLRRASGRWLKAGGHTIPRRITCLAELVHAPSTFHQVELDAPYYQFTGIAAPAVLSESRVYHVEDFEAPSPADGVDFEISFTSLADSPANAIRFTSIAQMAPGITFFSTDSLQPPVIVPLKKAVDVRPGGVVRIRVAYDFATDWNHVTLEATPVVTGRKR
jgi:predicted RNA methylase